MCKVKTVFVISFTYIFIITLMALSFEPVGATIVFSSSFENSDLREWSGTNVALGWTDESGNPQPAPIVSSANPFSGTDSLLCPPQYHSQCVFTNITPTMPTVYMQCEIYFDKLPSASNIVTFMSAEAQPNDWINIINTAIYNDNGIVKWIIDTPPFYPDNLNHAIPAKASSGPEAGKYYSVQLGCTKSGSSIVANLWVNGQNVINNYNYKGSSANFGQFLFGSYDKNTPGAFDGISVYLDDAQISDKLVQYSAPSPVLTASPTTTPAIKPTNTPATASFAPTSVPTFVPTYVSTTVIPMSTISEAIVVVFAIIGIAALFSTIRKRRNHT
jgi:hypothetical protein